MADNSVADIFQFLTDVGNPLLEGQVEDMDIPLDPILSRIQKRKAQEFGNPIGNEMQFTQKNSGAKYVIGDTWAYTTGNRGIDTGKIKFKKITASIEFTEDEMDIFLAPTTTQEYIKRSFVEEKKTIILVLGMQMLNLALYGLPVANANADPDFIGLFSASSVGDLSDPSDLNGGTVLDLDAYNFTGTAQTPNNVKNLSLKLRRAMLTFDANTQVKIPIDKITLGVHPDFKIILDSEHDLLNTTSKVYSTDTYTEAFKKMGIDIVENIYFDATYTAADGASVDFAVIGDIDKNYSLYYIQPPKGSGWTADWSRIDSVEGNLRTIKFVKDKKMQIAFRPQAYGVVGSDKTITYYKTCMWAKTTPEQAA